MLNVTSSSYAQASLSVTKHFFVTESNLTALTVQVTYCADRLFTAVLLSDCSLNTNIHL